MMRRFLLTATMLLSFPVLAGDVTLGRLFFTPAERAALDIVRQNSKVPEKIVDPEDLEEEGEPTVAAAPTEPLPVVTVHGYVKRSDGKETVWVNGRPVSEKSAGKPFEVGRLQGNTNQVQVRLPATGQTVKLKPGQSFDPDSNRLVDSLRDLPSRQPEPAPQAGKPAHGNKTEDATAPGNAAAKAVPSPAPAR